MQDIKENKYNYINKQVCNKILYSEKMDEFGTIDKTSEKCD